MVSLLLHKSSGSTDFSVCLIHNTIPRPQLFVIFWTCDKMHKQSQSYISLDFSENCRQHRQFWQILALVETFFFLFQVKRSATSSNISFLASELKVFSSNHANIKGSSISFEAIFLGIVCLWCVPLINSNLLMWEENVSLYT